MNTEATDNKPASRAPLPATPAAGESGPARILCVDDEPIYTIKRAKVGLFRDISYREYPHAAANSRGGRLDR